MGGQHIDAYLQLERDFAAWSGTENCVAVSSGTAALHLALEALELPLGSEVIVSDLAMVACPRAISLAGLVPVFVDCRDDLLIDPTLIPHAVTERTRAIMAVHIYGRRCDMDAINRIANERDLIVVEDMAEIHGVRPHAGTEAACFSFYRNKIIHAEEGGAIAFRCKQTANLARQLRSLGFTDAHDFMHLPRGCNYRMPDGSAKLVLQSLADYPLNLAVRRLMESAYDRYCPPAWKMPERAAPWVYDLRLPDMTKETQTRVVHALLDSGIRARMCFQPMSMQPEFKDCAKVLHPRSTTAVVAREVIYLPLDVADVMLARRAFEVIQDVLAQSVLGVPLQCGP